MRHRKHGLQLGRTTGPRQALAAGLVCHLIEEKRIRTTLSKAKLAQRLAEKVVTLAKRGQLADRRRAVVLLRRKPCVKRLFEEIVPRCPATSGHVRILKLGPRRSDSSEMA
ncbi:MAG: 50S ribosomal protein L17, partial [Lentisphaerae bacterium]|nr:50S ribosomal protein L17 [Lentisphaerota bacterium]